MRFNVARLLSVLVLILPRGLVAAADCVTCAPSLQGLAAQTVERAKYADLIRRNKEYLEKAGNVEPSVKIKVNSNILIASLRMETNDNRIEAFRAEIQKKGCQTCPIPVTR